MVFITLNIAYFTLKTTYFPTLSLQLMSFCPDHDFVHHYIVQTQNAVSQ
jgi:hypothetical protein